MRHKSCHCDKTKTKQLTHVFLQKVPPISANSRETSSTTTRKKKKTRLRRRLVSLASIALDSLTRRANLTPSCTHLTFHSSLQVQHGSVLLGQLLLQLHRGRHRRCRWPFGRFSHGLLRHPLLLRSVSLAHAAHQHPAHLVRWRRRLLFDEKEDNKMGARGNSDGKRRGR